MLSAEACTKFYKCCKAMFSGQFVWKSRCNCLGQRAFQWDVRAFWNYACGKGV